MSIKIFKKKLLLVEGKDEESFFEELLKKKEISEIQIMTSHGKHSFKDKFPVIMKTPGFDRVVSLAIIRDADENALGAFESVCSVLRNNELNAPKKTASFIPGSPKIGVFIIPGEGKSGMLESLCMSTVESEQISKCINSFMSCMEEELQSGPKNIHKAKCRAFLSAMEEDVPSLGLATKKGYWDLNSNKLKSLLDFLKQI